MKRTLLLLVLVAITSTIYAQYAERVMEDVGKKTSWSKSESLVYEKTLNGETWYNPNCTAIKGEIKDEWRLYKKFDLKPRVHNDSWEFSLPLNNINNEDKDYYNPEILVMR